MSLGVIGIAGGAVIFGRDGSRGFEDAIASAKGLGREAAPGVASVGRPLSGSGEDTVIPARGTDPAEVADWWASLSPDTREQLIEENYAELGMLRGLPAQDIDRINRRRLDQDIDNLSERLANVNRAINGLTHTPSGKVDPELYAEQERLQIELSNVQEIKKQMDLLDQAHRDEGGPQPYLLTYAYQNEGRFAVALGNPDTADNTAVLVPGAGHDVKHEDGHEILFPTVQEGQRLYNKMNEVTTVPRHNAGPQPPAGSEPITDNSVIVWLGTDMPDDTVSATNGTYGDSEHGARWLHDDVAGYQAASAQANNGDNHLTVVAHSYGSYLTGEAIKMGMRVDDLVSIGSAGIDADNAGELGMANEHVWAAAADGDVTAQLGWHGTPPTWDPFDAMVFDTKGSSDHGEYLKPHSQSLDNIALIAVGDYDDVSLRPPDGP